MDEIRPGKENRRYPRVAYRRPVRYWIDDTSPPDSQLAYDLSEGGIRMRTREFIPLGHAVRLSVQLREDSALVGVLGKVVWVRYNPDSDIYQMGVEFAQTSPAGRVGLGQLVRAL